MTLVTTPLCGNAYSYKQRGHLISEYENGKPVRDYLWAAAEPLMQVKIKSNGTIGRTT
ncbi:MAG: hypothetical protein P1U54_12055 [Immundisolibacteraceae bacterium]|nr:hypothetical protein [Immundisolibacteraceae bacterium]